MEDFGSMSTAGPDRALCAVRTFLALVACTLAACSRPATGLVRDAASGRPVAGAVLQTSNPVWGFNGGHLVWDKERISTTMSDADGRFRFDVSGGTGLSVSAPGYPNVQTKFCPLDTLVLMGGPYPALAADRRLLLGDLLTDDDRNSIPPSTLARDLGIRASGSIFENGSVLRIEAPGVRFVPGTGAIPAPPPLPYSSFAQADLARECGWFFVSNGTRAVAVIEAAHPAGIQAPGGPWRWFLMYAPLPG
jgi:hypothetical protein